MRVVNCGVGVVSLFFFFPFPLFPICSIKSAGRSFSVSCFPPAAGHQLLFEHRCFGASP